MELFSFLCDCEPGNKLWQKNIQPALCFADTFRVLICQEDQHLSCHISIKFQTRMTMKPSLNKIFQTKRTTLRRAWKTLFIWQGVVTLMMKDLITLKYPVLAGLMHKVVLSHLLLQLVTLNHQVCISWGLHRRTRFPIKISQLSYTATSLNTTNATVKWIPKMKNILRLKIIPMWIMRVTMNYVKNCHRFARIMGKLKTAKELKVCQTSKIL